LTGGNLPGRTGPIAYGVKGIYMVYMWGYEKSIDKTFSTISSLSASKLHHGRRGWKGKGSNMVGSYC
jgi:hypothetical protein